MFYHSTYTQLAINMQLLLGEPRKPHNLIVIREGSLLQLQIRHHNLRPAASLLLLFLRLWAEASLGGWLQKAAAKLATMPI